MIETQYIIYDQDAQYRVCPHPDHEDNEIIMIQWREPGDKNWKGEISFPRDAGDEIARCILALVKNEPVKDI